MRIFTSLLLLSLAYPLSALGQTQSFTLEQVMSSPFPTELTAAADTNRVAWVFDLRGERNVWSADAPNFQARQVTHYRGDDGQQILSLRLTPDGKTIVYSRGSEISKESQVANPTTDVKEPKQQVWAVDVEGAKLRLLGDMGCEQEDCEDIQISPDSRWAVWSAKHHLWLAPVDGSKPARQLTELRGDEIEPQWSPDGKHIAFVSDRHDHSFIAIYDLSPERVRYVSPSADRDSDPRWSPDGTQIVFIRTAGHENHLPLIPMRPHPWALWIADPSNGSARLIWHSNQQMSGSLPHFATKSLKFAAGQRIVFCSEHDGRNHLYSISSSGGSPLLLTPGDYDVEDVELTKDKTAVLFTSNQGDVDRRHVWRVNASGTPLSVHANSAQPQPLTQGKTIEWEPVMLASGKTVLCLGSSATSPAMPYRLTDRGREMIAADVLPRDFPSAQLVEPRPVTFHSKDGLEIHGQLFVPRNLSRSGAAPAILFVHGGPRRQMMLGFHYMQYYHNAYAENEYLASLGYVVLSVNYRLGIMYGRAFREVPNTAWRGEAEYQDVLAGAEYLRALPYLDAKRIGIWGGSYGGLLTALALSRNSNIFAAGVDFHGIHDWSVLVRIFDEDTPDAPDYKEAVKLAYISSPIATIGSWKSPVLLIHGDDDRTVPFPQTTDLVQHLKRQRVDFEELIIPDEVHDFLLWRSWVHAYEATADFFNRKLSETR